jgi:hypothetical protein
MIELSHKPTQEIILTQPILQWEFIRKDMLVILTADELRVYIRREGIFSLYHFYLCSGRNFCWVDYP